MSADHTCRVQLDRLRAAGLRIRQVPELIDVDTVEDAVQVARQAPGSRFAATLSNLHPQPRPEMVSIGRHITSLPRRLRLRHRLPRSASPAPRRGRGADWTEERGARNEQTRDEGRRRLQSAPGGAKLTQP